MSGLLRSIVNFKPVWILRNTIIVFVTIAEEFFDVDKVKVMLYLQLARMILSYPVHQGTKLKQKIARPLLIPR